MKGGGFPKASALSPRREAARDQHRQDQGAGHDELDQPPRQLEPTSRRSGPQLPSSLRKASRPVSEAGERRSATPASSMVAIEVPARGRSDEIETTIEINARRRRRAVAARRRSGRAG